MQYIEFRKRLSRFVVFSLIEIRKACPSFHRRRLNEWQDKGYIKKIIKGYYIFSDMQLDERALFEISNRIYAPSYISLEMALAHYGLIPESVYAVTSISTRRTYRFKTDIAEFSYRTVKPELFFGYDIIRDDSRSFKMAVPEKALVDYFYINPHIKTADDYDGMRLNKKRLTDLVNTRKIMAFAGRYGQKTLTERVKSFLEFTKNA